MNNKVKSNYTQSGIPIKDNQGKFIGWQLNENIPEKISTFNAVMIRVMSEKDILYRSNGLIEDAKTLYYKTLGPSKGGLFCEIIFGTRDSFMCNCQRYVGLAYKGLRCEKCNVEVESSRSRKLKSAHINTKSFTLHPFFLERAATALNITKSSLKGILQFLYFIFVEDSPDGLFKKFDMVTSNYYYERLSEKYSNILMSGGKAVYCIMKQYDFKQDYEDLKEYLIGKTLDEVNEKHIKRFKLLKLIVKGIVDVLSWFITTMLVIPPDLRPIISIASGGFCSNPINYSLQKIHSRSTRLARLIKEGAHEIITNHDDELVKDAIEKYLGPQSSKQKNISDILRGKRGLFRQGSRGKRNDYTGRGVITSGPNLKINECGIPWVMLRELYKPYAYSIIMRRGLAVSIVDAKKLYDNNDDLAKRLVLELSKSFPIIVNRAPTLHMHSMIGLIPIVTEDESVKLNPLVCIKMNADNDGDTILVKFAPHQQSNVEINNLLMSTKTLFTQSSGELALAPNKDILVGLYYLSLFDLVSEVYCEVILSIAELNTLLSHNIISSNRRINFMINDNKGYRTILTNAARLEVWESLRFIINLEELNFDMFNVVYNKKTIHNLIMYVFDNCGQDVTIEFLNFLTKTGFYYATQSGISFSIGDMIQLKDKAKKEVDVNNKVDEIKDHYDQGLITSSELQNNTIDIWLAHIDDVTNGLLKAMSTDNNNFNDSNNVQGSNIHLMVTSGARASPLQILQMCGLRGFVSNTTGEPINFVIKSCLRNGVKPEEMLLGNRSQKSDIAETADKTAKSGYLNRKLTFACNDVIITKENCETKKYIEYHLINDKRKFGIDIANAIKYRTSYESIYQNNEIIVEKDQIISDQIFNNLIKNNIKSIKIRSPLYCCLAVGVCSYCYGADLMSGGRKRIVIGSPVGIIAAQAIGEPSTQLTMDTIHTGGIGSKEASSQIICAEINGILDYSDLDYVINSNKERIVCKDSKIYVRDKEGIVLEEIDIKEGSNIVNDDNKYVLLGDVIATKSKSTKLVIAKTNGIVTLNDLEGVVHEDMKTGIKRKKITLPVHGLEHNLQPSITISNDTIKSKYILEQEMLLLVEEGQKVKKGDILAKLFIEMKMESIKSGLSRVIDILEVKKKPNNTAIMATHDGIIYIQESKANKKSKTILIKHKEKNTQLAKFNIPKNKHIVIQEGQECKKGDIIMHGEIDLQNLLTTMGLSYLTKTILGGIGGIYTNEGVTINYRYLEIVLKQMTQWDVVFKEGESEQLIGTYIKRRKVEQIKEKIILNLGENKKMEFETIPKIVGITTVASKLSRSFLSRAAFQNTISKLSEAALVSEVDYLTNIVSSVMMGQLMPAGTGYYKNQINTEPLIK